jgi:hypothetical protein
VSQKGESPKGIKKTNSEPEIISKEVGRSKSGEHQGVKSEVIKVKRQRFNQRF